MQDQGRSGFLCFPWQSQRKDERDTHRVGEGHPLGADQLLRLCQWGLEGKTGRLTGCTLIINKLEIWSIFPTAEETHSNLDFEFLSLANFQNMHITNPNHLSRSPVQYI